MMSLSNHGAREVQHQKPLWTNNISEMYRVYILRCCDGKYYTGVTNNIELRILQHQQGLDPNAFTYKRRPIELVFNEVFKDIDQAIAFEKQVKGWRREKKEAIINGDWNKLPELSKAYTLRLTNGGSTAEPGEASL